MYTYRAHVVDTYDGDTITVLIDLGFDIRYETKIRLYGINSPELRKGTDREKGLYAKKYLSEQILGKEITLQTFKDKKEKYGRYLGQIFLGGVDINNEMVKKGFALVNFYGKELKK